MTVERAVGCWVCKALSRTVGRLLYALTRQRWGRLEASRVRPTLHGLNLVVVGGLAMRGALWLTLTLAFFALLLALHGRG